MQEIQTLLWLADADCTTGGFVSVSGFLSSVAMAKKIASIVHNPETHKLEAFTEHSSVYSLSGGNTYTSHSVI